MKSSFSLSGMLQYLYVIFASTIGIAIAFNLFMTNWDSPFLTHQPGTRYLLVLAPSFIAFIFVIAALFAFLAVIFFPMWKQFFDLLMESLSGKDTLSKLGVITIVLLGGGSFLVILQTYLQISDLFQILPPELWPTGLSDRVQTVVIAIVLTILPIPLISLLIFDRAYGIGRKVAFPIEDKTILVAEAYELIRFRKILQNTLLINGVTISVVPVMTAILRSAFIDLYTADVVEKTWPIIYPIMFGLGFTTVLIIFYAPAHLMLNQAGQQLRDAICPINNIADIEANMQERRELDDWLQTNLDLVQNLKAGIATLAPLITGFLTSIPGLKIF